MTTSCSPGTRAKPGKSPEQPSKDLFGGGGLTFPEVQECHRYQYTEYQHCKLLCESDYCNQICLDIYTHEVELCYTENGFPIPPVLIPPPRP